ncbi:helix-turn-helix domain-containing protein [Neobacillus bataviensis]|nr:helix-turn-helix domain-containing protein [Neobacillus bataviensis]
MNEFGEYLKALRGNKSIREAAEGIGVSHTYLTTL